jgi:hypothetical protein
MLSMVPDVQKMLNKYLLPYLSVYLFTYLNEISAQQTCYS